MISTVILELSQDKLTEAINQNFQRITLNRTTFYQDIISQFQRVRLLEIMPMLNMLLRNTQMNLPTVMQMMIKMSVQIQMLTTTATLTEDMDQHFQKTTLMEITFCQDIISQFQEKNLTNHSETTFI